jgi:hypothetical protein
MSDANTKALLHFNADNNSTSIDDYGSAKIWTASGTAVTVTRTKKFGRASLYLDGDTGYISTPDHADWTLGSSDFTFDFWLNFPALLDVNNKCIFSKYQDASNYYEAFIVRDFANPALFYLTFYGRDGGAITNNIIYQFSTSNLTLDIWHHFEIVCSGTVLKIYMNGVMGTLYSASSTVTELTDITGNFEIGRRGTIEYLNAYMDEFRFSTSARHTENFTVMGSAYKRTGVDDEYTAALFHFAGADGSTTITDSVGAATANLAGTVAIESTDADCYKFGLSSVKSTAGAMKFTLTGSYAPTRLCPWAKTYATIDFWFWCHSFAAVQGLFGWDVAGASFYIDYDQTAGNKRFKFKATNISIIDDLVIDTWYHVAFVKNGAIMSVYINGVLQGSASISAQLAAFDTVAEVNGLITQVSFLGNNSTLSTILMDELRISANIQRFTTDPFTLPTEEYGSVYSNQYLTETINLRDTADDIEPQPNTEISSFGDIMEAHREIEAAETSGATLSDTYATLREVPGTEESSTTVSDTLAVDFESNPVLPEPATLSDEYGWGWDVPGATLTLPVLTLSAEGIVGSYAEAVLILPKLTISSTAVDNPIATLSISLPKLRLSSTGAINEFGTFTVTLPALRLITEASRGATASATLTLPFLTISASAILNPYADASITLPMLKLSAEDVPSLFTVLCMNLRNNALTTYADYQFNSFCRFRNIHLGACDLGIYTLSGTKDLGEHISWNFRTGYLDLEMNIKKRLKQAWISCKSSEDITVTVIQPDAQEFSYAVNTVNDTEGGARVKFGKGIKSKYVALDISGSDEFELDAIRLNFDQIKKVR